MASTILEQILENVSRGARLPGGADPVAAVAPPPRSAPAAAPAPPTRAPEPPPPSPAPVPSIPAAPFEDATALLRVVIDEVDLRLARLVERVLTHPALRERADLPPAVAAVAEKAQRGQEGGSATGGKCGTEVVDVARAARHQATEALTPVDPRRAIGASAILEKTEPLDPARIAAAAERYGSFFREKPKTASPAAPALPAPAAPERVPAVGSRAPAERDISAPRRADPGPVADRRPRAAASPAASPAPSPAPAPAASSASPPTPPSAPGSAGEDEGPAARRERTERARDPARSVARDLAPTRGGERAARSEPTPERAPTPVRGSAAEATAGAMEPATPIRGATSAPEVGPPSLADSDTHSDTHALPFLVGEDTDIVYFVPSADLFANWGLDEETAPAARPVEESAERAAGAPPGAPARTTLDPSPAGSPGGTDGAAGPILHPPAELERPRTDPPVVPVAGATVVEQVEAIVEEIAATCAVEPDPGAPLSATGVAAATTALDEIRELLVPLRHLPELLERQGSPHRAILEQVQSLAREVREIARTPRAPAGAAPSPRAAEEEERAARRRRVAIDDIQGMIESLS